MSQRYVLPESYIQQLNLVSQTDLPEKVMLGLVDSVYLEILEKLAMRTDLTLFTVEKIAENWREFAASATGRLARNESLSSDQLDVLVSSDTIGCRNSALLNKNISGLAWLYLVAKYPFSKKNILKNIHNVISIDIMNHESNTHNYIYATKHCYRTIEYSETLDPHYYLEMEKSLIFVKRSQMEINSGDSSQDIYNIIIENNPSEDVLNGLVLFCGYECRRTILEKEIFLHQSTMEMMIEQSISLYNPDAVPKSKPGTATLTNPIDPNFVFYADMLRILESPYFDYKILFHNRNESEIQAIKTFLSYQFEREDNLFRERKEKLVKELFSEIDEQAFEDLPLDWKIKVLLSHFS